MVYVVQYMHMKLANTVELHFEFSPTIYQSYNLPDLRHGRTSVFGKNYSSKHKDIFYGVVGRRTLYNKKKITLSNLPLASLAAMKPVVDESKACSLIGNILRESPRGETRDYSYVPNKRACTLIYFGIKI